MLYFLLKAMFIFLLVTWIRWSFVRIRVDQILAISWKLLLPATLVLLMATAVVVAWKGPGSVDRPLGTGSSARASGPTWATC